MYSAEYDTDRSSLYLERSLAGGIDCVSSESMSVAKLVMPI
ncbi:hypothetical protein Hbor_31160 (plasmid) [Halogeometricum borinquense DSM 11551]|uniref:Uncharacterized protein n=1 Tax=Halogeometricum borinquense (strain ATCC 700274 / DSM 11551 / JCM 10706 / KCTC 4070 / PR3) TaxID=469382 RepID=E4NUD1_HALBP|nr:hypothetical protein Hbor_31160 [Halogeometricum borinquense DSM 11551]